MNTGRRPRVNHPGGRPQSVFGGRQQTAPDVRLPAPPPPTEIRDQVAERDLFAQRARERVPDEIRTSRPPAPRSASQSSPPAVRPGDRPRRTGPGTRELLRRSLASPGAARQAFVLREVLGPPVALRTEQGDRPS